MLTTVVIEIPSWGNATILEIAWTCIGAVTMAVVLWNFAGAKANLLTPVDLEDEYEIEAARVIRLGYLRRETVRFVFAALILATGLTGCVVAPVTQPTTTTLTGLVLTGAFFVMGVLNTLQSMLDLRDRHEVRDLLFRSRRVRKESFARQEVPLAEEA